MTGIGLALIKCAAFGVFFAAAWTALVVIAAVRSEEDL